jgi:hypothetical protein
VKFSGHAPCAICYYLELEFGHWGSDVTPSGGTINQLGTKGPRQDPTNLGPTQYGASPIDYQSNNFENSREAWIEWCSCDAFMFRMGQILTPNTRQLMTAPELQQFVDISLASAFTGHLMPGYTDRNRDHGIMFHGRLGCNGEFSWMAAITNGDGGDSIRNVVDDRTDDSFAASGRFNWAFLKPTYYEEGALRQTTCEWYGEVGAWAHYYADRVDGPHLFLGDNLNFGVDLSLGTGGFSFTGAFTLGSVTNITGEGHRHDDLPGAGGLPVPEHGLGDRGALQQRRSGAGRVHGQPDRDGSGGELLPERPRQQDVARRDVPGRVGRRSELLRRLHGHPAPAGHRGQRDPDPVPVAARPLGPDLT